MDELLANFKPTNCDDCDTPYVICDGTTEYCKKDMIKAYEQGRADALKEAKDYISKAIGHDGRNGWSASTWKEYIEGCFDELMKGAE